MSDPCLIPVVAALFLGAILPGAALLIMSSALKRRLQRCDPARIEILAGRYRARFGSRAVQVVREQIQGARLCEDARSVRLLQAIKARLETG
ncbi:MAG: hypothetical protein HLUCCO17_05335 [Saliniramus fredricksonii]|uniref:Uncharacterized protein n=2 Tax=Saliniramus fredricksonii TaxID=1653334 RepID=A0A0P7X8R7_9HYPH|nr:MAG: hypothetical protein HLUCCO17_05335 [Saliniramus fredricksonii]SCC80370.1 hypothetical protein GA0071312_1453 [Saliniramus fredricksonii]